MMKKMMQWVLAATLLCGLNVFSSCVNDNNDNPVIDNLAEKLQGKWMIATIEGRPALTSEELVVTFLSSTYAICSESGADFNETAKKWNDHLLFKVTIDGNKVTLIGNPSEHITLVREMIIKSISDDEIRMIFKHTTLRDGEVVSDDAPVAMRLGKVDEDYSLAIQGLWEGSLSDGEFSRWEFFDDGTFHFYRQVDGIWQLVDDEFSDYFVDGILFCSRWKNAGENTIEKREWFNIKIEDDEMKWMALIMREDGTLDVRTIELTQIPED
jgi:hypothetical protein